MPNWLVPYQFKPGQSGNPAGRPKGRSLMDVIRERLEREMPDGELVIDKLADAIIARASCEWQFAKELLDRSDGPIPQTIAGRDGGPITIRVEYADDPAPDPAPPPGPGPDPAGDAEV
jgi:hypothetical protein